jgi:hypothetical protein
VHPGCRLHSVSTQQGRGCGLRLGVLEGAPAGTAPGSTADGLQLSTHTHAHLGANRAHRTLDTPAGSSHFSEKSNAPVQIGMPCATPAAGTGSRPARHPCTPGALAPARGGRTTLGRCTASGEATMTSPPHCKQNAAPFGGGLPVAGGGRQRAGLRLLQGNCSCCMLHSALPANATNPPPNPSPRSRPLVPLLHGLPQAGRPPRRSSSSLGRPPGHA